MQYYNQTDEASVKATKENLESSGFNVSVSRATYEIRRETSQYNKYMKWHLVARFQNGSLSSNYFKTRRQAIECITKPQRPLPIGDRMCLTYYQKAEV